MAGGATKYSWEELPLLEGSMRFWIGEDETEVVDLAAGDVLHIPSWVPHQAGAPERLLELDVFSPRRQDWLDESDAYLRR